MKDFVCNSGTSALTVETTGLVGFSYCFQGKANREANGIINMRYSLCSFWKS